VLAHALFGCCAHQAHAGSEARCVHAVCGHDSDHHHDHAGEQAHQESATPAIAEECDHEPEPADSHTCQHQNCLWTVSNNGGFDLSLQVIALYQCVDSLLATSQRLHNQTAFLAADRHGLAPALPVRSHIALSILLI